MNLPKRHSARRNRTEYPEHGKDAAGPDPGEVDHLNWVAATVGEYGWAVSGSRADRKAPPWAYSIGMWLTCQVPELILCGLPVEDAASIINAIGARAADGVEITPETVLDDVCPTPIAFRPVDLSWRKSRLLTVSDRFYGMVRVPYLQVVWSDAEQPVPLGTRLPARLRAPAADALAPPRRQPALPLDPAGAAALRFSVRLRSRAKMMPMSSPGWFNDLPEYMTEAEYRDLSEEISRAIEIVHGHVIRCESRRPSAQSDRPATFVCARGGPLPRWAVLDGRNGRRRRAMARSPIHVPPTGRGRLPGSRLPAARRTPLRLELEQPVRLTLPDRRLGERLTVTPESASPGFL